MSEPATEPMVRMSEHHHAGDDNANLGRAVVAGLAAAVVGAILWGVFVYVTNMELGLVAIAVGALVGISVQKAGGGSDSRFGFVGAVCAGLGWAMGTVLCDLAFLAKQAGQPFLTVVGRVGLGGSIPLAMQAADAMDLLFLAIAVWEGYKLATRRR